MKSPYQVVLKRYVTEKAAYLAGLPERDHVSARNRCQVRQLVFLVDRNADKIEIRRAVEQIYAEQKVKVKAVNTLNVKPKAVRMRGRKGVRGAYKKAIVTLEAGVSLAFSNEGRA